MVRQTRIVTMQPGDVGPGDCTRCGAHGFPVKFLGKDPRTGVLRFEGACPTCDVGAR